MKYPTALSISLLGVALLNISLVIWNGAKLASKKQDSSYSYIGNEFPFFHPSLTIQDTSLTYQESLRFGFNATDQSAAAAWSSLTNQPGGFGRAHLGKQRRSFLLTFYHQFHCISQFQRALNNRKDEIATLGHVNHCLQYLRQTLLCSATDTLERGDFMKRNFVTNRIGPESACVNWEVIFGEIDTSWKDFTQWRQLWN